MIYVRNGETITGQFKTENGTTYPANWCDLANPDDLADLGIIALTEIFPVLGIGQEYSPTNYVDDMATKTRTYAVVTL